ncbi:hypothetical protein CDL12_16041 [Handroanthus impetiginosus]|uniref:Bifunctional inhibitor/plant lipid transfer protein/seed storage helical domain-containing protein n=1 Tax=Handroanthus impetiginosus TaxID=429701 RepID=A0A2G9H1F8_9LAMI|nr:hypothetical protein CDL12_16041 [Handroanthus impetiginosus]
MLSLLSLLPIPIALVLLSLFSPHALAQSTIAECGPNLVGLAPCGPFVQGMAAAPVQTCCDGLKQLYTQKPTCICLLLHDTSLASSFPINTTLALQLPLLCNLNIDATACSGTSSPTLSPPSQVSFGAKPNSTVAASPIVTMAPRPSFMGFGLHQSAQVRLKAQGQLLMLLLPAISTVLTKYVEL